MSALGDFLAMGGYGFYVWSAYGVALVVLVANLAAPLRRERELRRQLDRQLRLEQRSSRRS